MLNVEQPDIDRFARIKLLLEDPSGGQLAQSSENSRLADFSGLFTSSGAFISSINRVEKSENTAKSMVPLLMKRI
jgi:hypothetical protein